MRNPTPRNGCASIIPNAVFQARSRALTDESASDTLIEAMRSITCSGANKKNADAHNASAETAWNSFPERQAINSDVTTSARNPPRECVSKTVKTVRMSHGKH